MSSRKSLKINQKAYKHILSSNFKHKYYFSTFNSLRAQNENFEEAAPTLQNFSSHIQTLNLELPYPVSSSLVVCDGRDRCLDLLTAKANFEQKMRQLLYSYKQDRKWLTKKYVKSTKYAQLPKYMIDLCTGHTADPDKYFSGNYDWYYTGGTLDFVEVDGSTYFLHSDSQDRLCEQQLSKLYRLQPLITLSFSGLSYLEDTRKTFPLEGITKAPIFSLRSHRGGVIAVRQKNSVHLLKLVRNKDGLTAKVLLSNESKEVPFIDVKYKIKREVCIAGLDRRLKFVDVEMNKARTKHRFSEIEGTSDPLVQVEYRTAGEVVFLDRKSVRLLDKRSLTEKVFHLKNKFFTCDDLCTFAVSKADSNYLFACSKHNVIKIDLREMKVVKKCSHLLGAPPLMIKSSLWGQDEIVFVSSQKHAERVILCSNQRESNLVQYVPNNLDTLRRCDLTCNLNLGEDFRKRLMFSTSGINMRNTEDGRLDLYTCNCNGDIFKSSARPQGHDSHSDEAARKLNDWVQELPKKPFALHVTSLREMSKWKFMLTETHDTSKLSDALAIYSKPNDLRNQLLSEISNYETDMAVIWSADKSSVDGSLVPSDETTPTNKVSEWLQTANSRGQTDESDMDLTLS